MLHNSILDTIGNTPLVKLNKYLADYEAEIFIKLDGFNPGGSSKDRIAKRMIEEAIKKGDLTPDKTIIEATSGNTGIGLAMAAAYYGFEIVLTMSESATMERKKILRNLGAKIIETPKEESTDGAIRKAHEIIKKNPNKYWMPNQYANLENINAHYFGTAEEIYHDLPEITHFVSALGTSGTLMGVSKFFREKKPEVKLIGIEPLGTEKIDGLKNMEHSITPVIYNRNYYDEQIFVKPEEALQEAKDLIQKEGILVGFSTGAVLYGARKIAEKEQNAKIVVFAPDRIERYLSTDNF